MALSRGLPRVAVSHHLALWSPDLPRRTPVRGTTRSPGQPIRPVSVVAGADGGEQTAEVGQPWFTQPMSRRRLVLGSLVAVTVAATGAPAPAQTDLGSPAASSASGEGRRSTNVRIETPQGRLSSYLVNAPVAGSIATTAVELRIERAGGTVVQAWPEIGVVVAHSRRASFRERLRSHPEDVLSVGATRTVRVKEGSPEGPAEPGAESRSTIVADPREDRQWDMRVIGADQAHDVTDGSADVLVGILDTGIDPDHPDLAPNLDRDASVGCDDAGRPVTAARAWRPSGFDHGTHVAGTVAAARNDVGIVGVAPGVRIASVKVVNDDGLIYPEYAVCGFMWAGRQGMDVTNNSYYVDPFQFYCDDRPDQAAALMAVERAVTWSRDEGVVHAAAAGNAATDLARNRVDNASPNDSQPVRRRINGGCLQVPGELPGVVTVSSYARIRQTFDTRLSYFSNTGLGVIDVAAPGSDILSTVIHQNGYGRMSGTSMASPHVAGVLALLVSTHPDWTPGQLTAALLAQADDQPCRPPEPGSPLTCRGPDADNSFAGDGMVDALAAVTP